MEKRLEESTKVGGTDRLSLSKEDPTPWQCWWENMQRPPFLCSGFQYGNESDLGKISALRAKS